MRSKDGKKLVYQAILMLVAIMGALTCVYIAKDQENIQARHLKETTLPACVTDAECDGFGPAMRPHVCIDKFCAPKPIFPLNSVDLAGTIGAFVCIVISSGGGLGGGGLLVPLYMIVLGFTSHDAIPLSKATIFGSAIASCILNIRQKHPLVSDRQLIDYEVMVMMEPMTLAGTIIGVSMNKVCPEWIITILLVLLLGKTSQRMVLKGLSIWRQEAAKDDAIRANVIQHWQDLVKSSRYSPAVVSCAKKWKSLLDNRATKTLSESTAISMTDPLTESDDENANDDECLLKPGSKVFSPEGKPIALDELTAYKRSIPWSDMSVLFVAWIGLFGYSMMKGGHGAPSIIGLVCGSTAYWGLTVLAFPFFAAITSYFGFKILHRHELMLQYGHIYIPGDIKWTRRTTVMYPSLCTIAGVAAGLLGIGGGMVKGPLLLEIGLHPLVASATSSAMILFTSSATTIQFIVLGMLPYDYAAWYGLVGFFGSIVGQLGLSYLIRKYRKTAFVLFIVAAVIGVSCTVMGILGVKDIIDHGFRGFRSLCYSV